VFQPHFTSLNAYLPPFFSDKTSFQLLYNQVPSVTHLCIFDSLCYATVNHPKHKFDPHAQRGIFVGYPPSHKGYNYMILKTTLFFLVDVVFHEIMFPFHETIPSSHSSVLPNLVLDLDHQNSIFLTTLPNSQLALPTLPSEPITEPIPIEPIPEPMTTEFPAPNSSPDISTQPLRHYQASSCMA